jgi:hypothetical protein
MKTVPDWSANIIWEGLVVDGGTEDDKTLVSGVEHEAKTIGASKNRHDMLRIFFIRIRKFMMRPRSYAYIFIDESIRLYANSSNFPGAGLES